MKKRLVFSLLIGCFSVVHAQVPGRFTKPSTLKTLLTPSTSRQKPLILAHRGGPDVTDTENSLDTFRKTFQQIPEAILEMDVRMTNDSVLTLLHDDELERTTTGSGSLKSKTWKELSMLMLRDLSGKPTIQRMPLFADVLRWNQNRAILALDVKPGVDLQKVMQLVTKSRAINSVFVICYTIDSARRLREQYPDLWLALGIVTLADIDKLRQSGLALHNLIALTPRKLQPAAFYEALHRVGMPCSVGTYGKENLDEQVLDKAAEGYRAIFKQGGDILTTDRPIQVNALFK